MVDIKWVKCLLLCCCVAFATTEASGEEPKPFPDFSAKRVTPPQPGQKKRITVQIETIEPSLSVAAPEGEAGAPPIGDGGALPLSWFWQDISPKLTDSGPGRLEAALNSLANPPAGEALPTPRLNTLQSIVEEHGVDILLATIGTEVSPALVLSVIAIESAGQADAVSQAGAQGLMQLMPDTAERFAVEDSFDPAQNIGGGVKYLDFLTKRFSGDPILMLAGYNAGEGAIAENEGVPPFPETRAYVPKVLAAFQVARVLCVTPPELMSDGCVFARP